MISACVFAPVDSLDTERTTSWAIKRSQHTFVCNFVNKSSAVRKGKERKSIYIAPFCTKVHSKRSGVDHTVLPANNITPAFPSWRSPDVATTATAAADIQLVAEMGDRGHNRHEPKRGGGAVPLSRSAGNPSNTMLPAPRSNSVPSGVFIHRAVWPQ